MLYFLSLSHVMDTGRTFFFTFLLANHQLNPLIAWQCMSLVTSYSCILYQISCLKFHSISDHIAVVFSFKCQERVWCIWWVQTPGSTCTIKARSLKTFLIIWTAVIKPTYTGVEAEWRPCLYRVGLFDKAWDLPPSRFPWETAHDNCHSIWPRRWSWKFFGQIFPLKSG